MGEACSPGESETLKRPAGWQLGNAGYPVSREPASPGLLESW